MLSTTFWGSSLALSFPSLPCLLTLSVFDLGASLNDMALPSFLCFPSQGSYWDFSFLAPCFFLLKFSKIVLVFPTLFLKSFTDVTKNYKRAPCYLPCNLGKLEEGEECEWYKVLMYEILFKKLKSSIDLLA